VVGFERDLVTASFKRLGILCEVEDRKELISPQTPLHPRSHLPSFPPALELGNASLYYFYFQMAFTPMVFLFFDKSPFSEVPFSTAPQTGQF
jgi:hypothetical protein